jgi:hypothetical protein
MPSEKRAADAELDTVTECDSRSRNKRQAITRNGKALPKSLKKAAKRAADALSLSLRCLLSEPIPTKDLRAVINAHTSKGHEKFRVTAFVKRNNKKVLESLLSLAKDRDAEDRALAFELLRLISGIQASGGSSHEKQVFDTAWSVMTAATGFKCDGYRNPDEAVKHEAFMCAQANEKRFAARAGPILDQLESLVNLKEAQEALRICSLNFYLYADATILERDLDDAAQVTAQRLLESSQPQQQLDGMEYILSFFYHGEDLGAEEAQTAKRIATLFTTSTDSRVIMQACECTTNWSVLDELNKTEHGTDILRAMLDRIASAKDKVVATAIMGRLTDFINDTIDDYLDGREDPETIETKIKELIESRGIDLVLGWTKSKPVATSCLSLLQAFCSFCTHTSGGSPSIAQNLWTHWLKSKLTPSMGLEIKPDVCDDTDIEIFEHCTRLLTCIVQGSENPAERIELMMQKGFLRSMFDVLGKTGQNRKVLQGGEGVVNTSKCAALLDKAALSALARLLKLDSSTDTSESNFAKYMKAPQSLTMFLKLCSSGNRTCENSASELVTVIIQKLSAAARIADSLVLDRIHAAACACLDAIPLPFPVRTDGKIGDGKIADTCPLTGRKGGLEWALMLLLEVWKKSPEHRRNFAHFNTILLMLKSVGWRTLGRPFSEQLGETTEFILRRCVEIINHLLKANVTTSSSAHIEGQFRINCLLEPGVVPLLTFISLDSSHLFAKAEATAALKSLEAWVKTDTTAMGILSSMHAMGSGYGACTGGLIGGTCGSTNGNANGLNAKDNLLVSLALLLGNTENKSLVMRMGQLGLVRVLKGLLAVESNAGAGGGGSSSSAMCSSCSAMCSRAHVDDSALQQISIGCAILSKLVVQTDLLRKDSGSAAVSVSRSRGRGGGGGSQRASRGASRGASSASKATNASMGNVRHRLEQNSKVERASCAAFAHMLLDSSFVDVRLEVEGSMSNEESPSKTITTDGTTNGKQPSTAALSQAVPGPTAGGGFVFEVHRFVLVARSEYFQRMFSSNMVEAKEKTIKIRDVSPLAMRGLLEFLYSGNVTNKELFGLNPLTYEHERARLVAALQAAKDDTKTVPMKVEPSSSSSASGESDNDSVTTVEGCSTPSYQDPSAGADSTSYDQLVGSQEQGQISELLNKLKFMKQTMNTLMTMAGGGSSSQAAPMAEDVRPLTYEEKRSLSLAINKLPGKKLNRVLQIISERMPLGSQNGNEEIEIDLAKLDSGTLTLIQRYVKSALLTSPELQSRPLASGSSSSGLCSSTSSDKTFSCSLLYADADQELLVLANRYQTDGLKALAEKRLLEKMESRGEKGLMDILPTVIFASTHEAHTLKKEAVHFLVQSLTKYTPSKDVRYMKETQQRADDEHTKAVQFVQLQADLALVKEVKLQAEEGGDAMDTEGETKTEDYDQGDEAAEAASTEGWQEGGDTDRGDEAGGDTASLAELEDAVNTVAPTKEPTKAQPPWTPSIAQVWLEADPAERSEVLQELIYHLSMRLDEEVGADGSAGSGADNPLPRHGHVYCPSGHSMAWSDRRDGCYSSGWLCDACNDKGSVSFHPHRFNCNKCTVDYCKCCYQSFTTKPNPFVVTDSAEVDMVLNNVNVVAAVAVPAFWACPMCTYSNPTAVAACDMCGSAMPALNR